MSETAADIIRQDIGQMPGWQLVRDFEVEYCGTPVRTIVFWAHSPIAGPYEPMRDLWMLKQIVVVGEHRRTIVIKSEWRERLTEGEQ